MHCRFRLGFSMMSSGLRYCSSLVSLLRHLDKGQFLERKQQVQVLLQVLILASLTKNYKPNLLLEQQRFPASVLQWYSEAFLGIHTPASCKSTIRLAHQVHLPVNHCFCKEEFCYKFFLEDGLGGHTCDVSNMTLTGFPVAQSFYEIFPLISLLWGLIQ